MDKRKEIIRVLNSKEVNFWYDVEELADAILAAFNNDKSLADRWEELSTPTIEVFGNSHVEILRSLMEGEDK
jgi:collagenase-like PrtC family protease